jgi:hypothetical protein
MTDAVIEQWHKKKKKYVKQATLMKFDVVPKPNDVIIELEVQKMEDRCPKCDKRLLTDGDTIWCGDKKCKYEWFP